MTPAQFKEWYETLKGLLPPHDAMVYRLTLLGGFVCLVAANFAPEHQQAWMNVSAGIIALGAKFGSSPAKSPEKE